MGRQLFGIFGGGILGLALGYVGVVYFGGPAYNFLNLPLPAFLAGPDHRRPLSDAEPPIAGPSLPAATPGPDRRRPGERGPDLEVTPGQFLPAGGPSEPDPPAIPPDAVGVLRAGSYSYDDLARCLIEAADAVGCPDCHSTGASQGPAPPAEPGAVRPPCRKCHGTPTFKITGTSYRALCNLAEAITFLNEKPDRAGVPECVATVTELHRRLLQQSDVAQAINRHADALLKNAARPTSGIVIFGTVRALGSEGRLHWYQFELDGTATTVTVSSRLDAQLQVGQRLGVLGSIVDKPAENLAGYTGDLEQVVWGGLPVTL